MCGFVDMSDELDVDSDFKKARAFLVIYSTLAMLLWYFSADLSSISILGNTVKLKENTNNAWAVASLINIYFLLRFIQKVPAGGFSPDDAMRLSTDGVLIWLTRNQYKSEIVKHAEFIFSGISAGSDDESKSKIIDVQARGIMPYWKDYDVNKKKSRIGVLRSSLPTYDRKTVVFAVGFSYMTEQGVGYAPQTTKEFSASSWVRLVSQVYGFFKAGLLTPWFTDYIIPVLYALASIIVSLVAWWQVNHVYLVC